MSQLSDFLYGLYSCRHSKLLINIIDMCLYKSPSLIFIISLIRALAVPFFQILQHHLLRDRKFLYTVDILLFLLKVKIILPSGVQPFLQYNQPSRGPASEARFRIYTFSYSGDRTVSVFRSNFLYSSKSSAPRLPYPV